MRDRLFLLVILVGLFASSGCGPIEPTSPAHARDGAIRAPLRTLTGEATDLSRVARGRVTLVALWATWCEGCKREVGALSRLDARARKRGDAVVVAVAVGDSRDEVARFAHEHALSYEQLVDEDFALADALGERRVPTTLILDRSGGIVYRGNALDGAALAALRRELE